MDLRFFFIPPFFFKIVILDQKELNECRAIKKEIKAMTREEHLFEGLSRNNFFNLCRVKVLESEPAWIVSHEFTDIEVLSLLKMPKKGRAVSFKEAYKMRWLEKSRAGYLKNSTAVRTPLPKYLKSKGFYLRFSPNELRINPVFWPRGRGES